MITVLANEIRITFDECFDPAAIFECGQVFRYLYADGVYTVHAGQKSARIERRSDFYSIVTDDTAYFYSYFDLDTDYGAIIERIKERPFMQESLRFGKGLRILRQEHFENIISFIISANNNVKRISGILNRLCAGLGNNYGDYYGFPTAEAMAAQNEAFYQAIGAGYRASYILDTARAVAEGFDPVALEKLDTPSAKAKLMKLKGVGSKVADCILLFSYARKDVFPVDTWIRKVYCRLDGSAKCIESIRKYLLDLYGEYSGYAQQYLFYAHRSGGIHLS